MWQPTTIKWRQRSNERKCASPPPQMPSRNRILHGWRTECRTANSFFSTGRVSPTRPTTGQKTRISVDHARCLERLDFLRSVDGCSHRVVGDTLDETAEHLASAD